VKIKDIIAESSNMASAEQIWDYVGGIHPKDQQGGGFLKRLIMRNPQYELKRVPLSSLHVPNDEDDGNDPYGRAMFVDVDHAREYSQHHVDKKPVVADAEGHILDGAHRAWAAAELLNRTDIMAWVPAEKLTEIVAEGKEQFNYELAQKGFHFEQEINGVTYRVSNKKGGSDNINIEALDDKGQSIGFARFWMHQYKDSLESLSTQVRDDWQGKGIAANMYAVMRMLGVNIHPASMQSDDGKKMWSKWNKQGDAQHIKSMNSKMTEQDMAEGQSVKQEIKDFIDSLTPADVGVEEFPGYRVHFEGFTDECKSSSDYQKNPDKVYQQVYQDFVQREGGKKPAKSGMVGDEEYPILYSVFRVPQSKTVDTAERAYSIAYRKKQPWPRGSREEQLIRSDWQLSALYDQYVLKQGVTEEQLDELFQHGKQNWTWKYKADTEAIAKFTVGDRDYVWQAFNHFRDDKPHKWEIQFRVVRQSTDPEKLQVYGTTGTGNSAEVMSIAVDIMREFLQYYGDSVQQIAFDAKENSRIALYRKMVQRLLPNWNADEDYNPEYGLRFTLTRPKSVAETRIINAERVDVYYRPVPTSRGWRVVARNIPAAALEPLLKKLSEKYAVPVSSFDWSAAQDVAENFADGRNPGRKGLAKRSGVNTKASVSSLRKTAKNSSGEKQRMAHWLANMKAGRARAKKK
jgi:hypothetical protein